MSQQVTIELKKALESRGEGKDLLEVELEKALKHLHAYEKVVKEHIVQLEQVLRQYHNANLDTGTLPQPVQQLISIFDELEEEDLALLEELAQTAKHWEYVSSGSDTVASYGFA